MKSRDLGLKAVFGVPVIVAILSLFGLIAALIGDGVWDGIGWLTLGVPVGVLVWALIARRHR